MLSPGKHSHPDQTVLAAATALLRKLREDRVVPFDELKDALEPMRNASDYLFTPAVSFLFLAGLVEYQAAADAFEYVGA